MLKKNRFLITVTLFFFWCVGLIYLFFFNNHKTSEPEIENFKESSFLLHLEKPLFYSVGNKIYHIENLQKFPSQPIWEGEFYEIYVSPNAKYLAIQSNENLILIDDKGKLLVELKNFGSTENIDFKRKSGYFLSSSIQWSKNSDYFFVIRDNVYDKNKIENNQSSIYKYVINENQIKEVVNLQEKVFLENYFLSDDEDYLYYETALSSGDLLIRKLRLKDKVIVSKHDFSGNKLIGDEEKTYFFNYKNYKQIFFGNSYDIKSKIAEDNEGGVSLFKDKETVKIITGKKGLNAKGFYYSFMSEGYFLPNNRYFVADIYSKQYKGKVIIDTENYKIMKLSGDIDFHFNVNSMDYSSYQFDYQIIPNIKD